MRINKLEPTSCTTLCLLLRIRMPDGDGILHPYRCANPASKRDTIQRRTWDKQNVVAIIAHWYVLLTRQMLEDAQCARDGFARVGS